MSREYDNEEGKKEESTGKKILGIAVDVAELGAEATGEGFMESLLDGTGEVLCGILEGVGDIFFGL